MILQRKHLQGQYPHISAMRSILLFLIFVISPLLQPSIIAQAASSESSPSQTALLTFSAAPQEESILLTWSTIDEVSKWGYNVWRSTTESREEAALITVTPILSSGSDEGIYLYHDTSTLSGLSYSYWVEELYFEGSSIDYGPITTQLVVPEVTLSAISTTSTSQQIFLPLLFGN